MIAETWNVPCDKYGCDVLGFEADSGWEVSPKSKTYRMYGLLGGGVGKTSSNCTESLTAMLVGVAVSFALMASLLIFASISRIVGALGVTGGVGLSRT
jgi:hypothetical protein